MVDCMDPPVKLWVLVVYEMPDKVLSVKEEKCSQSINKDLIQSRSLLWQSWCWQYEGANYYSRDDKEDVVVQRCQ